MITDAASLAVMTNNQRVGSVRESQAERLPEYREDSPAEPRGGGGDKVSFSSEALQLAKELNVKASTPVQEANEGSESGETGESGFGQYQNPMGRFLDIRA